MYSLKTEASFDSAHFLHGYTGKCSNIHGHRWRIIADISSESLEKEGQLRGMLMDFGDFKKALRAEADALDHVLILEENSLKPTTLEALRAEGFKLLIMQFRPTAENLAKYIFENMKSKGFNINSITVYETPNNCAVYRED